MRSDLMQKLELLAIPAGLVVLLLIAAVTRSPQTLTISGLGGSLIVAAPLILASIAITPVAIAGRGGVDLSVGPLIGFVNVTIVVLLPKLGLTDPVSVFVYAIITACIWQALLASIVIYLRVSPIIAALAGYMILQGVNLAILPRPGGAAPDWLAQWGYDSDLVGPVSAIVIIAFILWFIFHRSVTFQHIRLMGADERTAYTSGVNITAARFAAHLVGGVFAGLAAICLTGLIGSGDPTQGNSLTLQAITALVLGGTSVSGGRGGIVGSVLGAVAMFLVFVVLSSFNFGAVSGFMTQLSYGLILVLALLLNLVMTKTRRGLA